MIDYSIIGDIHIDERFLVELDLTFNEILGLGRSKKAVFLGDIFHKNRPTPLEVQFTLKWFKRFKEHYDEVIVILGNHDLYGGLQTTKIFQYLGITVIDKALWKPITSYGSLFFGHFFVAESIDNYSGATMSFKELEKQHKYVFLGHQHRFQEFSRTVYHLGSIRYVGFGEYHKPLPLGLKKIAQIDTKGELKFIALKSPYPLVQFNSAKELSNHYGQRSAIITDKVRIVYEDFDTYKNDINTLATLPYIFYEDIKVKLDFKNYNIVKNYNTTLNPSQLSTAEVVSKWLESIEDEEVKEILEKESKFLCD